MSATLVSENAVIKAMLETPQYKEFALKFKAEKEQAIREGVFEVKSLGVSMSMAQVAITYQAYKGIPNSLGENARAYAKSISSECLAIIKQHSKADWNSIQALAAHA